MELNDDDLYKCHDKLANLKKKTYDDIYATCINTIKLTSKSGELFCIFKIPAFSIKGGFPIVDIPKCANYVTAKLMMANENLKISFFEPNMLLVDWRK